MRRWNFSGSFSVGEGKINYDKEAVEYGSKTRGKVRYQCPY